MDTKKQRINRYKKNPKVMSNDKSNPTVTLQVQGAIDFVIDAQPRQINLKALAGSAMTGSVTFGPGTDRTIDITETSFQKDQCRVASIEPTEDGKFVVTIDVDPSDIPGIVREMLTVKAMASDGKEYTTSVPVIIDHQDRISVTPRGNIVFQRRDTEKLQTPGTPPVRRDVQVFANTPDTRFQVTGVEVLDAPEGVFKTEIHTVKAGERYRVSVLVDSYRIEPSIRARLRILTDNPQSPEKELRLYAQFGQVARPGAASTVKEPRRKVLVPRKPKPKN